MRFVLIFILLSLPQLAYSVSFGDIIGISDKSNQQQVLKTGNIADILEDPSQSTVLTIQQPIKPIEKARPSNITATETVNKNIPASMRNITPKYIATAKQPTTPKSKLTSTHIALIAKPTYIKPIQQPRTNKHYNIALMLPLTGDSHLLGKTLLNTAELATFNLDTSRMTYTIYDTQGTELGALKAIKKVIANKTDIIVGPLFNVTTKAVAPIAKQNNLTIISLSNDVNLADQNTLIFGPIPSTEIKRIINFAIENNIIRYSALLPAGKYGTLIEQEVSKRLDKHDIALKTTETYQSANEALSVSIRRITRLPKLVTEENLRPKSELLFIPESRKILPTIISRLSSKNQTSKRFRFVGTSDWLHPSIVSNKQLIGSWLAAPNLAEKEIFDNSFKKIFHYTPSPIASIMYDALSLLALETESFPALLNINNLTGNSQYEGINGTFWIDKSGIIQRELSIYEITGQGIEKID